MTLFIYGPEGLSERPDAIWVPNGTVFRWLEGGAIHYQTAIDGTWYDSPSVGGTPPPAGLLTWSGLGGDVKTAILVRG